jgi:hypothetical protein
MTAAIAPDQIARHRKSLKVKRMSLKFSPVMYFKNSQTMIDTIIA